MKMVLILDKAGLMFGIFLLIDFMNLGQISPIVIAQNSDYIFQKKKRKTLVILVAWHILTQANLL